MTMSMNGAPQAGPKKMMKVLCPIEKSDGSQSSYWIRCGTAFTNRDQSINLYLDVLPRNGKLQLRELDEEDLRERDARKRERPVGAMKPANDEQLPF